MTPKWNVISLAAIAVVVVIFLVIYDLSLDKPSVQIAPPSPVIGQQSAAASPQAPESAIPAATGNVEDISTSLVLDADLEQQAAVSGLAGDAALYGSDSQELSDLSSVYVGNEF
jgi:hypothetical protein